MGDGGAHFRGIRARRPVESIDVERDGARLAESGFWVVVGEFDGPVRAWRMADVERTAPVPEPPDPSRAWRGPSREEWESSLDRAAYVAGVGRIRDDIREGIVYQVNLCRVMSAPLTAASATVGATNLRSDRGLGTPPDAVALSRLLAVGNPARYAARVTLPAVGDAPPVWIVSASPELYLGVDGTAVTSSPIKGTAAPGVAMLDKDVAENVMITDLVRNDLSHVAMPGSVAVPELLGEHQHPGLAHLQSTVSATLAPDFDWTPRMWPALLGGTFPPGSVSGAPKSTALKIIAREEATPRGPYCGAIGWIDADARRAELAVGIRTFWWTPARGGRLNFGTGAGITWGSDPAGEWDETELKAARLIGLASGGTMVT